MNLELSKDGYLEELFDIRDKLKDFISLVKESEKLSYIKDISLKLRILYCSKSRTEALITTICDLLNIDIVVTQPRPNRDGAIFAFSSPQMFFGFGNNYVDLMDAIKYQGLSYLGNNYSYYKVIEICADKLGGAHIDKNINYDDFKIFAGEVNFLNLSFADHTLADLAEISIKIIDMIEDFLNTDNEGNHIKKRI